jgi:hypothetical protein
MDVSLETISIGALKDCLFHNDIDEYFSGILIKL